MKMMTKKIRPRPAGKPLWILLAFAAFFCTDADAYRYGAVDESRRDFGAGSSRKLGRGLANAGLGWTEVFRGIEDVSEEKGFWAAATWGPLYGTVNAVRRTAFGVFETATFPLAGRDGFEPVLEPEFPLSDN